MRTTISLDDQLAKQVRRAAKAHGISVSAFISMTLDDALKRRETAEPPPFQLVTVRGVHTRPGSISTGLGRSTRPGSGMGTVEVIR